MAPAASSTSSTSAAEDTKRDLLKQMESHHKNAGSSDVKMKAYWSYKHHKIWVELCLELVKQGRRPGTCLDKKGYAYLLKEFNKRTGLNYTRPQLKNHWDRTKGEWKQWKKLVSSAGSGWDPEKETVVPDDGWWANWLQRYPKDEKWRDKGLDFARELDAIFAGTVSDVDIELTPSQETWRASNADQVQVTPDTMDDDNDNTQDMVLETQARRDLSMVGAEIDDDEQVDIAGNSAHSQRKRIIGEEPSPCHQRLTARLSKQLERLCDAVESRNKATRSHCVEGATIKECIELLDGMPEIVRGSKLYFFAVDTFLKKECREAFVALELPEVRLLWLEHQMELATAAKQ